MSVVYAVAHPWSVGDNYDVGQATVKESSVKVSVNFDLCTSNAVCMSIAPEVFEVRDDGFLYILNEHPGPELAEKMHEAVASCPNGAISIEE